MNIAEAVHPQAPSRQDLTLNAVANATLESMSVCPIQILVGAQGQDVGRLVREAGWCSLRLAMKNKDLHEELFARTRQTCSKVTMLHACNAGNVLVHEETKTHVK